MCDCAFQVSRRRWLLSTLVASATTMLAPITGRAEDSPAVREILRSALTVDVHSHAAGMILNNPADASLAEGMKRGGMHAVCLAHVPDAPVLGRKPDGTLGMTRQPAPGELYAYHRGRLDWVDDLVARHGVRRVLTVGDLREARAAGQPAIIQDIEGCDFLDGKLERLEEAYRRGVRVQQLVHYVPNPLGDFQTGDVQHNGLTNLGADVIKELNRLGVVVDVAHSTEAMVRQAATIATRPLLLSHTALQGSKAMGETRLSGRQVSRDHARAIADTGGVVAVWHFFPSIDAYVDGLREMTDVVGADHVGVGSDQQTTPGAMQSYAALPKLVEAMLRKGFSAEETGNILGGNFVRIFARATGSG
jgi:membrane dipeptidase